MGSERFRQKMIIALCFSSMLQKTFIHLFVPDGKKRILCMVNVKLEWISESAP